MGVRPSRVRRLRIRKAAGNVALAGAMLAVGMGYLAVQKTVTLVVEGRPEAVRTMSASVGELLDTQGIVLGSGDLVIPSTATPLADGMTVVVDHGFVTESPLPSSADVGVWVMEGMPEPYSVLAARSIENWFSAGEPVGSSDVAAVRVVVMGKDHDVLTNAATVRELLSAMGIEPDRDDRVLPSPGTHLEPDSKVRYVQIEHRVREVEVPIPHTTFTTYSDDLNPGHVKLLRGGVDGLMLERYRVKIVNGEVVARVVLSRDGAERGRRRQARRRPSERDARHAGGRGLLVLVRSWRRAHRGAPLAAVRYGGHRQEPRERQDRPGGDQRSRTVRWTDHRPQRRGLRPHRPARPGRLPGPAYLVRPVSAGGR